MVIYQIGNTNSQYTYPIKFLLDLVLFLAVNNCPFGVNGFTFAVGFSSVLSQATALGLSVFWFGCKNLDTKLLFGMGVCIAPLSINVFGVAGESNSLKALTLLYGGLHPMFALASAVPSWS